MSWNEDFLSIAEWALRNEDLRHQMLYSSNAKTLLSTPGIAKAQEATIVLSIYETALRLGYRDEETVGYERPYPKTKLRTKRGIPAQNPKRSDLAFKDKGKGKNWAYVEVKRYGVLGKYWVQHDITKLKSITHRMQRWLFIYRVRPNGGKSKSLFDLLDKNFKGQLDTKLRRRFPTIHPDDNEIGTCEYCLAKVL